MSSLVRKSLRANGIVTLAFGVLLVLAAGPLAADFALPGPIPVEAAGLVCVAFGPALLWAARREPSTRAVLLLAALDAGWIAGSVLAAALAPMNALGRAFALAQALLVAVFVAMELVGLRRVPAMR
jgi:hypothetical protein